MIHLMIKYPKRGSMSNNYIKTALILAILLLMFSSCKTKKKVIIQEQTVSESERIIDQVRSKAVNYSSIEIKANAKTELEGKKYNFSIIYRNYTDSLIWVTVRAMLGIEVARLKCTPQEVSVFSRLAGIDETGDWAHMEELLGYPLDFYTLQAMMTRKFFIPGKTHVNALKNYMPKSTERGILLVPDFNKEPFNLKENQSNYWPFFLVGSEDKVLVRTRIVTSKNSWQLDMEYGDQVRSDFYGLPDEMILSGLDEDQQLEMIIRIQNVVINEELKTPFQ